MSILAGVILVAVALVLLRRSLTTRFGSAVLAGVVLAAILLLIGYYLIDSFTGSGIDTSVLYFLLYLPQTGFEGVPIREFSGTIAVATILIITALAISIYAYRTIRVDTNSRKDRYRALLGSSVLIAAIYVNPAVSDIMSLVLAAKGPVQAEDILGTPPENYASINNLSFEGNRKNFVLLYLESFERTFLDETLFPGLTPNLSALEKEALSFTDITQVAGSSHTIAGMIASQCGIPLSGTGAGSDLYLPGATCIGDLLNEEGYNLSYTAGASLEFAGEGTFYRTHGFQTIEGRDELLGTLENPDYHSYWGLHDDSLLAVATNRFDHTSLINEPFGMVVPTIDTHDATGSHMPESCDDFPYLDGSNGYLNSIYCADKLVSEFIHHVRSSPQFEDTILIVVSDHLARPNQATETLEKGERRNLFLAFGANIEPGINEKPGNTLDIAPTLLRLIGAETQALAYGRDLMGPNPTLRSGAVPIEQVLSDDYPYLSSLWAYPQLHGGFDIDLAQDRLVLGERYAELPVLIQLDENLDVAGLAYEIPGELPLESQVIDFGYDRRFVWVDGCNKTSLFDSESISDPEQFCALIGSLGSTGTGAVALTDGEHINYDDLKGYFEGAPASHEYYDLHIFEWQRNIEFVDTDVVEFTPPTGLVGSVAIRSTGVQGGESWVIDRETGDKVKLTRGLTLFGFNEGDAPVKIAHKDTCAYGGEIADPDVGLDSDFITVIDRNRPLFGAMAIVGHLSVVCYDIDPQLEELFSETAFTEWPNLSYNQPYVAILSGNESVQEFVGDAKTAMAIEIRDFIRPVGFTQRQLLWLPRVANAGGIYSGMINTNSFEALNASAPDYELIELDFSWTSDGHLVCIDDWQHVFIQNQGQPLTLMEFEARNEAYPGFQNCTLSTLADWLPDHDGIRIIMDVQDDSLDAYRMLSESYPGIQGRFIPQIYQPEDYLALRELGYNDIIWTLHGYNGDKQDVLNWIKHMDLLGLTMGPEWANLGLAREAREITGVLSWVQTINTTDALDALIQAGAAEVYTDYLTPGEIARYEIVSSGYRAGESSIQDIINGRLIPLHRGSNLIGLNIGSEPVFLTHFDGCGDAETAPAADPSALLEALKRQRNTYDALAIVVHDSAFCGSIDLGSIFSESGLPGWTDIGSREPYIGLIHRDGRTMEFSGSAQTAIREVVSIELSGN